MTPLETLAHKALLSVMAHFAPGQPITRPTFQDVMGQVRDACKAFEAGALGCPTGIHLTSCTCQAAIPGKTTHYDKDKSRTKGD